MDDYYTKYARPLDKLNIYELKHNLNKWRDFLREELEGLIYIKNSINSDSFNKIEIKTKNKFNDIIHKLENVSLKEIECITEFSFEIEKKGFSEIDDKIYTKVEYIRDNYNKILLNIQKMISSSNFLFEIRKKFENNKNSLLSLNFSQKNEQNLVADGNITSNTKKTNEEGKDRIEKIDKDLDTLKKDQQLISAKIEKKKLSDSSFREKELNKGKEYTVTKELDNLILKNSQNQKDDSIRSKKISQKFPKSQSKHRHFTPPQKNSNSANTIHTTSRPQTPLINPNIQKSSYNYEIIKNLIDEVEHLKLFCRDLKKSQEDNCIMQNEKIIFEKMKTEHIKLNADVNIIKEDIKETLGNYHNLLKRFATLEDENKSLKAENKNLLRYMQRVINHRGESIGVNKLEDNYEEYNTRKYSNKDNTITKNYYSNPTMKHSQSNQIPYEVNHKQTSFPQNNIQSSAISDISAFNNYHNQSSLEMNLNINNNLEKTASKKRYLIPKN